jgi:hypothetical protein
VRIAFIACSSYSQCQKLTELSSAEADVDLLGQRLSEPDAGFVVHSFRAERGLAEAVDQVLDEVTEPVDELFFYFSGYAVLNDERGPALLLDGERLSAFSLKRLRRVLAERAHSSLAVLDTVPAFDGQTSPADAVRTVASALADPNSGVHLLAASRPESLAFGRSPFSSLFELVLDWQSVSGSPVRVDGLYAAMQAEEALFSEVPAAEYFPGARPFELLRPTPAPQWSEAPPAVAERSAPEPVPPPPAAPSLEALLPPDPDEATPVAAPVKKSLPPPLPKSKPSAPPPPLPSAAAPAPAEAPVPAAAPASAATPETAPAPVAPAPVAPPAPATVASGPPPPPVRAAPVAPSFAESPPNARSPEALRTVALERLTECLADGRYTDALEHARAALRLASRDPETYRTLHLIFEKLGRPDGAWNVACVLDALGVADVNESLLASLHRPEGLLAAKNILDDYEWKKRQLYPERDAAFDALFHALGNATIEVGAETAHRKRRLPTLEPGAEQDPAKSTTTLARTLVWSARLLGMPTPKLYVVDGASAELLIAPTVEPIVLASKALGSGLGLPELAFLWARRLVGFRPEHRVVSFLTNAAELEDFVHGAQVLGSGNEKAFKRLEGDAKLFARGLKRHLRGVARGPLEEAAARIAREAIPASVSAYRRSVELAGARAGLLACGDLSLALRMTERFPQHGAFTPEEQAADLCVFSVSDEYAALRERLGVALKS